MDPKDLGIDRYDAGRDFQEALAKLGLDPEALFWAYDHVLDQFVLVIVTAFFDYAGPLALSERLFEAYRAAATPASIDPFILRLHSPAQRIFRDLSVHLGTYMGHESLTKAEYDREVLIGRREAFADAQFEYGGLEGHGLWILKPPKPNERVPKMIETARPWERFDRKVKELAA